MSSSIGTTLKHILLKKHDKTPVWCFGVSTVCAWYLVSHTDLLWLQVCVHCCHIKEPKRLCLPSSIVLGRVFPSSLKKKKKKQPLSHLYNTHKHGLTQFHEETRMDAFAHHTGSRYLTGGRGRQPTGAFSTISLLCGLRASICTHWWSISAYLSMNYREKSLDETGGGEWLIQLGEQKRQRQSASISRLMLDRPVYTADMWFGTCHHNNSIHFYHNTNQGRRHAEEQNSSLPLFSLSMHLPNIVPEWRAAF